ncbi:MAG: orotidine-5'-phosphate decarboxylase [Firmicutes bacterium]|nr:orotidine-5'-phosphate decarboxylase [Bacillota bacterium]
MTSIDFLIGKIKQTRNPSAVGLDPRLDIVPDALKAGFFKEFGNTPRAAAEIFLRYNIELIDALFDAVPCVKPQIAMYEQYGWEGVRAYMETVRYAKSKGLAVIGDVKRGDVGSTAEAYADGHIGETEINGEKLRVFDEDFITINPYLGTDATEPFLRNCAAYGKGVFVLVKTSNPGSGQIQDILAGGEPLYRIVGRLAAEWGKDMIGCRGYSSVCAVVGATHPEQAAVLRDMLPHTFFLVPGYGAQGGGAKDVKFCFDKNGGGAVVNSSRGIIAAWKSEKYAKRFRPEEFALAAREAALDMREELNRI